jgi:hypothetical protein
MAQGSWCVPRPPSHPHILPSLAVPLKFTSVSHVPAWRNVVRTLSGDGELGTVGTLAEGQAICASCYVWCARHDGKLPSEEVITRLVAQAAAPQLAGPCANPSCGAEETSQWNRGPGAHPVLPHTLCRLSLSP